MWQGTSFDLTEGQRKAFKLTGAVRSVWAQTRFGTVEVNGIEVREGPMQWLPLYGANTEVDVFCLSLCASVVLFPVTG